MKGLFAKSFDERILPLQTLKRLHELRRLHFNHLQWLYLFIILLWLSWFYWFFLLRSVILLVILVAIPLYCKHLTLVLINARRNLYSIRVINVWDNLSYNAVNAAFDSPAFYSPANTDWLYNWTSRNEIYKYNALRYCHMCYFIASYYCFTFVSDLLL